MKQVMKAKRYRTMAMGSLGDARYMLLRQYKFPDTYTNAEKVVSADHDRILMWNYERWLEIIDSFKDRMSNHDLENWFRYGNEKDILEFLIEALNVEPDTPPYKLSLKSKWTGFRILVTVNRVTGYPAYSFELFAKYRKSKTMVYSTESAPNVEGFLENKRNFDYYRFIQDSF